jgi:IclR family transcriptional regulator, KDG regulon repressor
MVRRAKKEYLIRSLDHTLDVLETLSRSPDGLGLAQIAREVGLHKNSVFRLLATLENRGFVERSPPAANYRLGMQAFETGYAYLHHTSLSAAAHPALALLVRDLGENAGLAVLREGYVFYQEEAVAERTVRVAPRLGSRLPLSSTASGKVFMAWMSGPALSRVLDRYFGCAGARPDDAGPPALEQARAELEAVREKGYALDLGGWEEGVNCVASPVFDFFGKVAGALSVTAPSFRLEGEVLAAAAGLVKARALEVSRRMGCFVGAGTVEPA